MKNVINKNTISILFVMVVLNLNNLALAKSAPSIQKTTVSAAEEIKFTINDFNELEESLAAIKDNPSNYCNADTESKLESFKNFISRNEKFSFAEKFDCPQLLDLARQSIKMVKEERIQVASSSNQFALKLPSGYVKIFTFNRPVSACEVNNLLGCNQKNGLIAVPVGPGKQ